MPKVNIYKLSHPSGKYYIGSTNQTPMMRRRIHINNAVFGRNSPLYRFMRTTDPDDWEIELLYESKYEGRGDYARIIEFFYVWPNLEDEDCLNKNSPIRRGLNATVNVMEFLEGLDGIVDMYAEQHERYLQKNRERYQANKDYHREYYLRNKERIRARNQNIAVN